MKLKVRFFAKLREDLGQSSLELELPVTELTVAELVTKLGEVHGQRWTAILNTPNTLCAVNFKITGRDTRLSDGDELAFYPPVTGG